MPDPHHLTLRYPLSSTDPDYLAILEYDNTGLLTSTTLSPTYYTDPDDIINVAYAYDAQHLIKSEIITYKDRVENILLNKSTLPGGAYALDWHRAVAGGDSSANVIRFNVNGKVNYFSSLSVLYGTIYPSTQVMVHHLDEFNNPYFVNFQSPSQFDASNRLVQTTLFADDIKVYPVIMKIDYYK